MNAIKSYHKKLLLVAMIDLLPLILGCHKLTESSQTTPKTDTCKDVKPLAGGEKGAFDGFNVSNCYDWIIMSQSHYKGLVK